MPKRGRPPKDEASSKSKPVSIRLTPELRTRLEAERTSAAPERSLSQEIELRIRETFDFDKSMQKLLGGSDYHYWLLRIVAEQIVSIEYHIGRQFLKDRFTFDQVKSAINTILDHFKPRGRSSPPERLTSVFEEQAIREFGKRLALLALVPIALAPKHRENVLVLPDFVDPIAASQHLLVRKNPIEELNEIWERERRPEERTGSTKPRRSPK
jgi:hypothetical protein